MKLIRIIFTSCLLINLFSCDLLDKEPHSLTPETYFNNEAELEAFLIGVYSPIMQEYFYGNFYVLYFTGGTDLGFYQRSTPAPSIICNTATSSTPEVMTYWRNLYAGVNRANMLLENADNHLSINEKVRIRVKAEALFLRSFYYFNLVQGWGDVPFRLKSTNTVEGINLPRTDKQIIYDQIIADIILAIPNLPKSTDLSHTGTVTQSAAQGILARIYLFRAGEHFRDGEPAGTEVQTYFREARDWALAVKDSGLHGLVKPYKQVFLDLIQDKYNSTGVRESIWEAEMAGNLSSGEYASGRIGSMMGFGATVDYSAVVGIRELTGMANPGYSYKLLYASLKLYDMYYSEGDTARGDWNITPYEYLYNSTNPKAVKGRSYFYGKKPEGLTKVDGLPCTEYSEAQSVNKIRCSAKFRREYELVTPKQKNFTPENFPILRYSDVLLMLAEAENEVNGPTDLAYECINLVRRRSELGDLAGLSQSDFRIAIKKERAMELCFEALRRWDLIRWGEFYDVMNGMTANISSDEWGSGFKYAVNYYKVSKTSVYYPIPDWELSTNNLIKQNPGW